MEDKLKKVLDKAKETADRKWDMLKHSENFLDRMKQHRKKAGAKNSLYSLKEIKVQEQQIKQYLSEWIGVYLLKLDIEEILKEE